MEIKEKKIILDRDEDYEFVRLVTHIVKTEYGDIKIRIKGSKPYQIVEMQKSILLTKEGT